MKKSTTVFFSLLISLFCFSQKIIRGKVIDKINYEPLQYAVISVGENGRAIMSDKFGRFRISLSKNETELYFSLIGYRLQSVDATKIITPLIITLERGTVDLKEVTITSQPNNASFHTISR